MDFSFLTDHNPKNLFWKLHFSSFSQCNVGVSPLNQYWALGVLRVGFDGSPRVDSEFSLGRAQKMKEMHPEGLSASPLLCPAQVRKASVEQLFCSTPGVLSFHGRSCELQPRLQVDLWSSFRIPPNKGSSQLLKQGGSLNSIGKISVPWGRLSWHLHRTVSHRRLKDYCVFHYLIVLLFVFTMFI